MCAALLSASLRWSHGHNRRRGWGRRGCLRLKEFFKLDLDLLGDHAFGDEQVEEGLRGRCGYVGLILGQDFRREQLVLYDQLFGIAVAKPEGHARSLSLPVWTSAG